MGAFLRLDGLLLTGGGDVAPRHYGEARRVGLTSVDPPRDRVELWLAWRSVRDNLPLLAICRGIQVLNVALGGTLYQDIPAEIAGALRHSFRFEHPRNYLGHKVQVEPDARLGEIMGPGVVSVNSFHHQSIKDVAPELVVTALAPDEVIEGVEIPGLSFAVGVQWHPEELVDDDPRMLSLFKAFVTAASAG